MIYIYIHVSKNNDVRLDKIAQLLEPSKYPQEGPHKENFRYIKLIPITQNVEEEISLNSLCQHWRKIFHLLCTKYVNKDINNNICLRLTLFPYQI